MLASGGVLLALSACGEPGDDDDSADNTPPTILLTAPELDAFIAALEHAAACLPVE